MQLSENLFGFESSQPKIILLISYGFFKECQVKFLCSVEEIPQFLASAGMTELPQSLGFDLTDPLSCHIEFFADLF